MLSFSVFIYTEPRSVHSKPRLKSSATPGRVRSLRPTVLSSQTALFLFNTFLFKRFRTLCGQRSTAPPFQSTVCTLFPVQRRGRYGGSFQTPFQPTCQSPLLPLCFQQLPTIKFCNHVALITMQIAGGVRGHSRRNDLKRYSNPRIPSVTPLECAVTQISPVNPLECAVPEFAVRKSFRMRSSKKSGGVPIGSQFPTNPAFSRLRIFVPSPLSLLLSHFPLIT